MKKLKINNKALVLILILIVFSCTEKTLQIKGNDLLVKHQVKADNVFLDISGADKIKLTKEGNEFWRTSIKIENIEELILQYKINTFNYGKENSDKVYQTYFGKNIKPIYQKKVNVSGQIIDKKIYSNALKEERDLTIYLPTNFDKSKNYPVIYFADGKEVKDYAYYVEKLIDEKEISEIILVGIHSGVTPEADIARYENHLTFFCKEVVDYVQKKYSEKIEKRSLFGYSNGASFSVSASLQYTSLYKHVMAFSIGWELSYENAIIPKEFPEFFLAAGSL